MSRILRNVKAHSWNGLSSASKIGQTLQFICRFSSTPSQPPRDDGNSATPPSFDTEMEKFKFKRFLSKDGKRTLEHGARGMSRDDFRKYAMKTIDYITDYMDTIHERRVTPDLQPGYLSSLIPSEAPLKPETYEEIIDDFECVIMPGIAHWQHPHFNAYFPVGNSFPSILGDTLSNGLATVGFSWAACPALTELEVVMMEWFGRMIGLPKEFLPLTEGGKGGGVTQNSASECNLVSMLAARHRALEQLKRTHPHLDEGHAHARLVAYTSEEAHSSVIKAAKIAMVKIRVLETDEQFRLRGEPLRKAIEEDLSNGLFPFFVSTTLGTTSTVAFDVVPEIGPICEKHGIWLHVDGAYSGTTFICPELRHHMEGIHYADSFNTSPNKFVLVNATCSMMWVRDRKQLTDALVIDPLYLQHNFHKDQSLDMRNWAIPLSRTFRSLKLWFVIRHYGIEGLQEHIRNHLRLAKKMEALLRDDEKFEIVNEVHLALIAFRLKGSNKLNQQLLTHLNNSGRIHMIPAEVKGQFVIRYSINNERTNEQHIREAFEMINEGAHHILRQQPFVNA